MKDPEEYEMMAYIAGIIDGDGSISLTKIHSSGRGIQYRPVIQVHNACRNMPAYMNKIFGGTLACDKPKKEGYKPIWKCMLQGPESCLSALEKLLDYLVIKKDSALILMEYLKNHEFNDGKETILGEKTYIKMKGLNLSRKTDPVFVKKRTENNSNDPCFWAYLAGLIDTDGSFSTGRYVRKPDEKNRQVNDLTKYKPIIQLTLVTGEAINYILNNCSLGNCYVVEAKTSLRGVAYKFSVSRREQCIEFIKKLLPYLQIKVRQAVVLLDFCRNYVPTKLTGKVPEEEVSYREKCHEEIVRLNSTPS